MVIKVSQAKSETKQNKKSKGSEMITITGSEWVLFLAVCVCVCGCGCGCVCVCIFLNFSYYAKEANCRTKDCLKKICTPTFDNG